MSDSDNQEDGIELTCICGECETNREEYLVAAIEAIEFEEYETAKDLIKKVMSGSESEHGTSGVPDPDAWRSPEEITRYADWYYHKSEPENEEAEPLFAVETIQNVIEHRLEEVEEKLEEESGFDRLNRNDLKARKDELQNLKQVFEAE